MGADLALLYVPYPKLTPERRAEIDELLAQVENPLSPLRQEVESEIVGNCVCEDYKEWINKMVDLLENWNDLKDRRDAAVIQTEGCAYKLLITGGLSWGDGPTELFDDLQYLDPDLIWDLLRKWAIEDDVAEKAKQAKKAEAVHE